MVFRRKYWLFYLLSLFLGARRQIFIVFALFLLVEHFRFSVNTVSVLFMINYAINWFLNPLIGRTINRIGERKLLSIEYSTAILVFTGYGINSHEETAHAARLAGADRADVIHFSDVAAGEVRLDDYQMLAFPGGFLDGYDLGAAQAAAQRWRHMRDAAGVPMIDHLRRFLDEGKLMIGICNGFQLLVKLGILPALDGRRCAEDMAQQATR